MLCLFTKYSPLLRGELSHFIAIRYNVYLYKYILLLCLYIFYTNMLYNMYVYNNIPRTSLYVHIE